MFTWICPACGREVPPSYTECPDCAARAKAPAPGTPASPERVPVLQAPQPRPPQSVPEPAPRREVLPTWLMTILFALALGVVGAGAYFAIQYSKKEPASAKQDGSARETPRAATSTPTPKADPLLKQIEVVGLRLT